MISNPNFCRIVTQSQESSVLMDFCQPLWDWERMRISSSLLTSERPELWLEMVKTDGTGVSAPDHWASGEKSAGESVFLIPERRNNKPGRPQRVFDSDLSKTLKTILKWTSRSRRTVETDKLHLKSSLWKMTSVLFLVVLEGKKMHLKLCRIVELMSLIYKVFSVFDCLFMHLLFFVMAPCKLMKDGS